MLKGADAGIETQILLDPKIKRNRTISLFRKNLVIFFHSIFL